MCLVSIRAGAPESAGLARLRIPSVRATRDGCRGAACTARQEQRGTVWWAPTWGSDVEHLPPRVPGDDPVDQSLGIGGPSPDRGDDLDHREAQVPTKSPATGPESSSLRLQPGDPDADLDGQRRRAVAPRREHLALGERLDRSASSGGPSNSSSSWIVRIIRVFSPDAFSARARRSSRAS